MILHALSFIIFPFFPQTTFVLKVTVCSNEIRKIKKYQFKINTDL
jgi:hypothetical protein